MQLKLLNQKHYFSAKNASNVARRPGPLGELQRSGLHNLLAVAGGKDENKRKKGKEGGEQEGREEKREQGSWSSARHS